jgi:excinuclease UvrABC ATPase subunit
LQKPEVEEIEGLPPTIAIEQRSASSNPRSTVATTTEIYDYLRVLFARAGDAALLGVRKGDHQSDAIADYRRGDAVCGRDEDHDFVALDPGAEGGA